MSNTNFAAASNHVVALGHRKDEKKSLVVRVRNTSDAKLSIKTCMVTNSQYSTKENLPHVST